MTITSRLVVLILAIAQCAMPAVLSVVDGSAAHEGRTSHFEDVSGNTCQPAHSAECGLCRFLSTASVKPDNDAECPIRISRSISEPGSVKAHSFRVRSGFHSRAPPVA